MSGHITTVQAAHEFYDGREMSNKAIKLLKEDIARLVHFKKAAVANKRHSHADRYSKTIAVLQTYLDQATKEDNDR